MIDERLTELERRVLDIALHAFGAPTLTAQVPHLVVLERDRTGAGLFVHLGHNDRAAPGASRGRDDPPTVFVRHPELPGGATAIVWTDESGYIDTIEFVCLGDDAWPVDENSDRFQVLPIRDGLPVG